jgi:tripartite-type tricarboxylate transporter receptor subunit TctC
MQFDRRDLLRLPALLALTGSGVVLEPALANAYPTQTVKVIVPFGAGGPSDVFARAVAEELRKVLNQPFVIENRPGAGTTIGTEMVAKSVPDGHTLLIVSSTQTVNETLYGRKNYQLLRDLAPVAPLIGGDLVLTVHQSVPAKNVKELIALAKAKPGTLNYGSSGIGSNYHMAGELLKNLAGIDIVHVPYKGSTGGRNDIVAGQIEVLFDSVAAMAPIIKGGMVRALGTTGKQRSAIMPDVPTIAESGVPGFFFSQWIGMMAPAKTPPPIVERIHREAVRVLAQGDVRRRLDELGMAVVANSPAEFGAFIAADTARWAKVIKAAGIKLDE